MIALDIEDVNVNECFAVKLRNLFNLNDFLYSFLFGFVPSLADIVTDFTFTSRLAENSSIQIAQGWARIRIARYSYLFLRLVEEGEDLLAGLSYISITFPAIQLVIILSVNRLAKTNNQMTKSIVIIFSFIGEHLVHIKDYACFINSWQKNIPLTFLPTSILHPSYIHPTSALWCINVEGKLQAFVHLCLWCS